MRDSRVRLMDMLEAIEHIHHAAPLGDKKRQVDGGVVKVTN